MKKILYAILIAIPTIFACKKDKGNPNNNESKCNFLAFKYYNGKPDTVGEMSGDYILIGSNKSNSDNTIINFIKSIEYFDKEFNVKISTNDEYKCIIVKLKKTESCSEITKIMDEIKKYNIVDFVHYTIQTYNCNNLIYEPIGNKCVDTYSNGFIVSVKDTNDLSHLNSMLLQTKTKIYEQSKFRRKVFTLTADKNSKGDAWQMANYFYESGFFEYSEPSIFKVAVE